MEQSWQEINSKKLILSEFLRCMQLIVEKEQINHLPYNQESLEQQGENIFGDDNFFQSKRPSSKVFSNANEFKKQSSQTSDEQNNLSLIEEFFIIGIDPTKITLEKLQSENNIDPQTLYMLTQNVQSSTCQQRLEIKNFCFPNKIRNIKLQNQKKIKKILYGQNLVTYKNSFIFTLNENSTEKYQCVCLVIDDLIEGLPGELYLTQKAYCIMSKFKHYELHLTLLNQILNLQKHERLKMLAILNEQDDYILSLEEELLIEEKSIENEVKAHFYAPLISKDIINILLQYNNLKPESKYIKVNIPYSLQSIEYQVPCNKQEENLNDLYLITPPFLSLLKSYQFYELLTALLLEKTIIFISDTPAFLSSAIIGLQCFLYPFNWCQACIPILPENNMEALECPMPILIGIVRNNFNQINSIIDELNKEDSEQERIIVEVLDNCKKITINSKKQLSQPFFQGLYQKLEPLIQEINSFEQILYQPGEQQKKLLYMIYDLVTSSLRRFIQQATKNYSNTDNGPQQRIMIDKMKDLIQNEDKQFFQQFKNTQMLMHYLESNF